MSPNNLKAQFAALHAQRERDWPEAQLRNNIDTRAALVSKYDSRLHIQPGKRVEDFMLVDTEGKAIRRDALIANGPTVLIFFRFGGCPACNIALPYYDRHLSPLLTAAGIPLVAVSPQSPADATLRARHGLALTVASDPDNKLGDLLGITFEPDDKPVIKPGDSWIGSITGTNSWRLPQPTVLTIESDATVRYIAVSPDWLDRPEPETILAKLPEVKLSIAA